jgi:hypothetical protein
MTHTKIIFRPGRKLLYLLPVVVLLLNYHISFAQSTDKTVSETSNWDVTLLPPDSAVVVVIAKCEPSFHPDWEKEYQIRVNVVTLPVDSSADYSIDVSDKEGKTVARIANHFFPVGKYHLRFDKLDLPDGVYLLLYKTDTNRASGHLMVLRPKK